MMNKKAKELGMNDTTFKNCHGLDEDGHVTSAYDIAIMSRELLNNYPEITNFTTIYMDSLRDGKSSLVNTNKLIRTYAGCTGLKTGSTSLALFNLSASASRDGFSLIAVIMKAPTSKDRFSDAEKLLNYGYSNFAFVNYVEEGETLSNINVTKGIYPSVEAVFDGNVGILVPKGKEKGVSQIVELDENLEAPVLQGQQIGKVMFSIDDKVLQSVPLIAKSDVKRLNLFSMCAKVYGAWFNLLRK